MTTRRSNSAANAAGSNEQQPEEDEALPGVPPGVDAQVNIKYTKRIEPRPAPVSVDDELNDLALAHDNPPDPLSEFLETWANYVSYNCMVLRLPDPSTRRMPGQTYVRSHFGQPEQLGAVTFDPNPINFISSLQIVNGNSGGCFQIWLMDHNGARIQDAVLYSVAIADPPRAAVSSVSGLPSPVVLQQPREREKSDSERKLEEAKDRLFNSALERALNPAPVAPANGNGLSPEQNAQLFLLGHTDFLSGIFGKMSELATAAGSAVKEDAPAGWKDRAIDAGIQVFTTNPAIVDRLSATLERIVARVLPDPRLDAPLPPSPQAPVYYPPQAQPQQTAQPPNNITDLPETLDEDDDLGNGDDETMDMLDQLIVLFNSNDPLTLESPIVLKLLKKYPLKTRGALRLIASQPLDDIIEYVKDQGGAFYVSLLDGASGPHLRARMAEFKQLCEDGARKAKEQQAATASPQPTADAAATAQHNLNESGHSTAK